jgi:hypothetical protein
MKRANQAGSNLGAAEIVHSDNKCNMVFASTARDVEAGARLLATQPLTPSIETFPVVATRLFCSAFRRAGEAGSHDVAPGSTVAPAHGDLVVVWPRL